MADKTEYEKQREEAARLLVQNGYASSFDSYGVLNNAMLNTQIAKFRKDNDIPAGTNTAGINVALQQKAAGQTIDLQAVQTAASAGAIAPAKGEPGTLSRIGSWGWRTFVWDSEASTGANALKLGLTGLSLLTLPLGGPVIGALGLGGRIAVGAGSRSILGIGGRLGLLEAGGMAPGVARTVVGTGSGLAVTTASAVSKVGSFAFGGKVRTAATAGLYTLATDNVGNGMDAVEGGTTFLADKFSDNKKIAVDRVNPPASTAGPGTPSAPGTTPPPGTTAGPPATVPPPTGTGAGNGPAAGTQPPQKPSFWNNLFGTGDQNGQNNGPSWGQSLMNFATTNPLATLAGAWAAWDTEGKGPLGWIKKSIVGVLFAGIANWLMGFLGISSGQVTGGLKSVFGAILNPMLGTNIGGGATPAPTALAPAATAQASAATAGPGVTSTPTTSQATATTSSGASPSKLRELATLSIDRYIREGHPMSTVARDFNIDERAKNLGKLQPTELEAYEKQERELATKPIILQPAKNEAEVGATPAGEVRTFPAGASLYQQHEQQNASVATDRLGVTLAEAQEQANPGALITAKVEADELMKRMKAGSLSQRNDAAPVLSMAT